mgnify:FL=1
MKTLKKSVNSVSQQRKIVSKEKIKKLLNTTIVLDENEGYYKAYDFSDVLYTNCPELDGISLNEDTNFLNINRPLNHIFVNKLLKSFKKTKDSTLSTITLAYTDIFTSPGDFRLVVADGQHRIQAFQLLKAECEVEFAKYMEYLIIE